MTEPSETLTDAEAVALGRATLRDILAGKGTKETPLHFTCKHCALPNDVSVKAINTGDIVKVTTYFDDIAKVGKDDTPKKAAALLDRIRELTDEELAQEFYAE